MELDARQTLILAVMVLFLGRQLNSKIALLRHYSIPEPVTGGILASLLFSLCYVFFSFKIDFSLALRDELLIVFFTCVGLSSRFSVLLKGGKALLIMLAVAIIYLFFQNLIGIGIASLTGINPHIGLLGASVSLTGGHGTAIAWAPTFIKNFGIENAMEIGIACATFGLVLGGLTGGPIANLLINRYQLKPQDEHTAISVGFSDEQQEKITVTTVYRVLLIVCIAIGIGVHLHQFIESLGVNLPIFVPCLFGGIILTNTIPYINARYWQKHSWPTGTKTLALFSDFSLGLFLSMSLMSLQLWTLVDLALPILLLLAAQVIAITFFIMIVVFPVLGKSYDAAIISSGYAGLALGATPTAIANMTAVTKKYGASPQAFIVIPLVGAFFIDIFNSLVIETLLHWLS